MTAKELVKWRKDHGHSQQSLATELRMSVRQIIRYEQDELEIPYTFELALQSVSARPWQEIGRWPKKK